MTWIEKNGFHAAQCDVIQPRTGKPCGAMRITEATVDKRRPATLVMRMRNKEGWQIAMDSYQMRWHACPKCNKSTDFFVRSCRYERGLAYGELKDFCDAQKKKAA